MCPGPEEERQGREMSQRKEAAEVWAWLKAAEQAQGRKSLALQKHCLRDSGECMRPQDTPSPLRTSRDWEPHGEIVCWGTQRSESLLRSSSEAGWYQIPQRNQLAPILSFLVCNLSHPGWSAMGRDPGPSDHPTPGSLWTLGSEPRPRQVETSQNCHPTHRTVVPTPVGQELAIAAHGGPGRGGLLPATWSSRLSFPSQSGASDRLGSCLCLACPHQALLPSAEWHDSPPHFMEKMGLLVTKPPAPGHTQVSRVPTPQTTPSSPQPPKSSLFEPPSQANEPPSNKTKKLHAPKHGIAPFKAGSPEAWARPAGTRRDPHPYHREDAAPVAIPTWLSETGMWPVKAGEAALGRSPTQVHTTRSTRAAGLQSGGGLREGGHPVRCQPWTLMAPLHHRQHRAHGTWTRAPRRDPPGL